MWYLAPRALAIPYQPKPGEQHRMVNHYKATDETVREKKEMARWTITRIDERQHSAMTAFHPPYASQLYAEPRD